MTRAEMREFAENQVDFYKRQIEFDGGQIEYINYELKRSRQADKELVAYVWSKGVVTESDMRIFTKDYTSTETKKLICKRARAYRSRKHNEQMLVKYQNEVEKYTA